jgi:Bacterial SH3 domain
MVIVLLAVPLLIVAALPRVFDVVASMPTGASAPSAAAPSLRLSDPTPAAPRPRATFSSATNSLPPTLAPPVATATPVATPRPTASGEKIVIANTDGRGAVLRAEPVTGQAVAALREGQVLDVVERRGVSGSGEWVHVRGADGSEGWVTGLATRSAPAPQAVPSRSP